MPDTSLFKSAKSEAKYREAYNATLELWSVPYVQMDVPTRFGTTHIIQSGAVDLPPMVLIHGAAVCSTEWFANVAPLSQHFCVYAIDIMSQMGLSVPTQPIRTIRDCADWLVDVLDVLHIEQAIFAGHSYGGWMTMNLALTVPQRVEKMVLLCPAPALASLRWQMLLRMLPVFFMPTRAMFYRLFRGLTTLPLDTPHPLIEQFITGVKCFKPQAMAILVQSVFRDDELRQLTMPTLLFVGDHEIVYKPHVVLERAKRLMPNIEVEIVPNGGHLLPVDQCDAISRRILEFLGIV